MKDPTQTSSIRKAWVRQYNKRFRAFNGRVNRLFSQGKAPLDAEFVEFFDAWFAKVGGELLGGDWSNRYIAEAYAVGVIRSKIPTGPALVHDEAIKLLQAQAVRDVDAALVAARVQAVEAVSKGALNGSAKAVIRDEIKDRINKVGLTRSRFVANTLTPYASNLAEVNVAEIAGSLDGKTVEMRWVTRQDERVRTGHALRNHRIYSVKAAKNLIGEPGCRCRVYPVLESDNEKGYTEIREQGLALSKAAQRDQKYWTTQSKRAEGYPG